MAHDIHIVGTVPLADSEAVFTALATLGEPLKRMPDGETGPRTSWLAWLDRVFDAIPQLEPADELWRVHEQANPQRRRKLKAGASVEDIRFSSLPMGDFARDSYAVFRRLRDQGKILPATRFQVDFAPAHSAVRSHVVDALLPVLEPVYNDAICREVGRIATAIPPRDLAVQFDVASAVFAVLQRGDFQSHGGTKDEAAANFAAILSALGNSVPQEADLLFHFCYGDNNHRHSVEPKDVADMVDMANRLRRGIKRPINLIHMPVPAIATTTPISHRLPRSMRR